MYYLAEGASKAAETSVNSFDPFDIFMIVFTLIIAWGVVRSFKARPQNKFALGFGVVALVVFLFMDAIMVLHWINPA
jgi:hypothetical protein